MEKLILKLSNAPWNHVGCGQLYEACHPPVSSPLVLKRLLSPLVTKQQTTHWLLKRNDQGCTINRYQKYNVQIAGEAILS